MLLLLDLNDNITRFNIRNFISFSVNSVSFSIRRTFVNLNLESLLLLLDLLAIASFANLRRIHDVTTTTALVAWTCSLGIHTWSKLHHDCSHTLASAACAGFHC